jgi:hypothetical protein
MECLKFSFTTTLLLTVLVTAGFTPDQYFEDHRTDHVCPEVFLVLEATVGFLSKLKLAHQTTSASVKATLERDDSVNKAKEFADTLARLEGMEIEMSGQACSDTGLNPVLSTLRRTIANCKDTVAAYELAAGVSQALINAIDAWTKTYDMKMVEQISEASAIAINRAQKLHVEGSSLLKRFKTEAMAHSRAALMLV